MSVAGYLGARGASSRISRDAGREIGAEFYGAVLGGDLTAAERLGLEAAACAAVDGEHYVDVGEYDPVLRAHCRLV